MKRTAVVVLAVALAALGCRRGERIVVGSKNFGESVLLGEIVARAIEERSTVPVERRLNLGGTFVCDHAIRAGELDVYVEYTGTAYSAILKRPPIKDRAAVLEEVRKEYAKDGLEWTEPLGFENTFAIVVRGEDAERFGARKISDLAAHPEWRAAFGYEFMERADGFAGLAKLYGWTPREPPRVMELGLLYRALVEKKADVVAGNSTDGVIISRHLRVLADDRGYFPPYDAVPVARRAVLERRPEVRAALAALGGSLTADEMQRLNYRVEGDRVPAEEIAHEVVSRLPRSEAAPRPVGAPR